MARQKIKTLTPRILSLLLILCMTISIFPSSILAQDSAPPVIDTETTAQAPDEVTWTPTEEASRDTRGDLTLSQLKTAVLDARTLPATMTKEEAESKGHVNRLYQQETDENTIIFQNKDGTKTMYFYDTPVKYTDEDGTVKDNSNSIILGIYA